MSSSFGSSISCLVTQQPLLVVKINDFSPSTRKQGLGLRSAEELSSQLLKLRDLFLILFLLVDKSWNPTPDTVDIDVGLSENVGYIPNEIAS